jgi:NADH-quinone oxidoreductase subunit J
VAGNDNVRAIGRLLFTRYVFAFEATGLLLVVAAVGALVLGKRPGRPPATRATAPREAARREEERVP